MPNWGGAWASAHSRRNICAREASPETRANKKTAARSGPPAPPEVWEEVRDPSRTERQPADPPASTPVPSNRRKQKPRSKKQVARIEHRKKSRETAHTPSAGLRSFTDPFIDPGAERRTRWPNPGYTRSPVHSAGCND